MSKILFHTCFHFLSMFSLALVFTHLLSLYHVLAMFHLFSSGPTLHLLLLIQLLEKAMAPHSSTFAWKIPWTEEPGGLQSMGSLESDTTERLHFHFSLSCIGGDGNHHSSVLAWRIPGMGKPGGLPSLGSHRVGHD